MCVYMCVYVYMQYNCVYYCDTCESDDMSWASFINFEMRQGQLGRARDIYERYVALLPTCRAYLKYARWEERLHQVGVT
jgi:crooked neck